MVAAMRWSEVSDQVPWFILVATILLAVGFWYFRRGGDS